MLRILVGFGMGTAAASLMASGAVARRCPLSQRFLLNGRTAIPMTGDILHSMAH